MMQAAIEELRKAATDLNKLTGGRISHLETALPNAVSKGEALVSASATQSVQARQAFVHSLTEVGMLLDANKHPGVTEMLAAEHALGTAWQAVSLVKD